MNIFIPHLDIISSTFQLVKINIFLDPPLPMSLPTKHVSPNKIVKVIQRLKPNKSPDQVIPKKILKHFSKKTIVLLTFIFNFMLGLFYIPVIWKQSIIILILKSGKPPYFSIHI